MPGTLFLVDHPFIYGLDMTICSDILYGWRTLFFVQNARPLIRWKCRQALRPNHFQGTGFSCSAAGQRSVIGLLSASAIAVLTLKVDLFPLATALTNCADTPSRLAISICLTPAFLRSWLTFLVFGLFMIFI